MKTKRHHLFTALALLVLATLNVQFAIACAQGTAFTYQGRLNDGASAASGKTYGMVFYLYDAPTNGNQLGNLGIVSVTVSHGLFTLPLDFGNVFDGNPRWLEISVQKNGGGFTTLNPRQSVTPAPSALFAPAAGLAAGAKRADGAGVTDWRGLSVVKPPPFFCTLISSQRGLPSKTLPKSNGKVNRPWLTVTLTIPRLPS